MLLPFYSRSLTKMTDNIDSAYLMDDRTLGEVLELFILTAAGKLQGQLPRFWEENILQFLKEVIVATPHHAFPTAHAP